MTTGSVDQPFPGVFGQDAAVNQLVASIHAGRVPHAYLFTGPAGVGKKTAARVLAKILFCQTPLSRRQALRGLRDLSKSGERRPPGPSLGGFRSPGNAPERNGGQAEIHQNPGPAAGDGTCAPIETSGGPRKGRPPHSGGRLGGRCGPRPLKNCGRATTGNPYCLDFHAGESCCPPFGPVAKGSGSAPWRRRW